MKKTMAFVSALVMAGSLGVSAFAADTTINQNSTPQTAEVALSQNVPTSYTVTIPTDPITVSSEAQTLSVSASSVVIEDGQTLNVSVSSNGAFEMTAGTHSIAYTITKNGSDISEGDNVLSVAAGGADATASLSIASSNTPKFAGNYTDTLTFTVSVDAVH